VFGGYGGNPDDFRVFHPKNHYLHFARTIVPHIVLPLVAVEKDEAANACFSSLIKGCGLEKDVIPAVADFGSLEDVLVAHGTPAVLAGAHFLSIASHWDVASYGGRSLYRRVPHQGLTELIGDTTRVAFLEEGDLIYDEGREYASFLHKREGTNGIDSFEKYCPQLLHLADAKQRAFAVSVYPAEFTAKYDREAIDCGQVFVSMNVLP
jgi:hypothetical protein